MSPDAALPYVEVEELRCSAKGCGDDAVHALLWNNPRLHTPGRRKVWLACGDHLESLRGFLGQRSFLRDVIAVADLDETHG